MRCWGGRKKYGNTVGICRLINPGYLNYDCFYFRGQKEGLGGIYFGAVAVWRCSQWEFRSGMLCCAGLWGWMGGPVLQGASTHSWSELAMLDDLIQANKGEMMFEAEPRLVDVSLAWDKQRVQERCCRVGVSGCWQRPSSCPQAVLPMEPPPFLG